MADQASRTGFGPAVGLGLVTAALTGVAAAKPWFRLVADATAGPVGPSSSTAVDMPLALALALVVLAGWGALLVSRGTLRRVLVTVGLAAAVGVVACVGTAPFLLPDDLREGLGPSGAGAGVEPTGWFVAAAVTSVLSVLVLVWAWRLVPRWPTMSSRYDAPAGRVVEDTPADLWKALDQGVDPTDSTGPPSP